MMDIETVKAAKTINGQNITSTIVKKGIIYIKSPGYEVAISNFIRSSDTNASVVLANSIKTGANNNIYQYGDILSRDKSMLKVVIAIYLPSIIKRMPYNAIAKLRDTDADCNIYADINDVSMHSGGLMCSSTLDRQSLKINESLSPWLFIWSNQASNNIIPITRYTELSRYQTHRSSIRLSGGVAANIMIGCIQPDVDISKIAMIY